MNSTGIATAGGFGKALAEWIQRGKSSPFVSVSVDRSVMSDQFLDVVH